MKNKITFILCEGYTDLAFLSYLFQSWFPSFKKLNSGLRFPLPSYGDKNFAEFTDGTNSIIVFSVKGCTKFKLFYDDYLNNAGVLRSLTEDFSFVVITDTDCCSSADLISRVNISDFSFSVKEKEKAF